VKAALAESQQGDGAAMPRQRDVFFLRPRAAILTPKQKSATQPSGREETDEGCDAQEEEDNDCAIDQAKPRLLGVVGRDERSIKNMALPAHVVCNPGHAMKSSMGRATGSRRG